MSTAEHARLLRLATRAALAVALSLAAAKAIAWWLSGSVSLLAGLTDSLLDGAASLLNLLAVNYALRPADEDHRYGHGKAEALAGLAQALLIGTSAVLVAIQALKHFAAPPVLDAQGIGIAVMLLSLAMTLALVVFQHQVVKRTGSTAIRADSLHYRSDLLLNAGILTALVISQFGVAYADPLFGLLISLYIFYSAYRIVREAIAILMDQALEPTISQEMCTLALSVPQVLDVLEVRTRVSGSRWLVLVRLRLPADLSLRQAHSDCEAVKACIEARFSQADVLVKAYPGPE